MSAERLRFELAAVRKAVLSVENALEEEELRLRLELQALTRARYGRYVDPMLEADFNHRGEKRVRKTLPDGPRA